MAEGGDFGSYDYIIVGAGSAGCVLANRLTQDADVTVLVLEAGGKDDYIWFHVPVGYLFTIGNPRSDWCFKTEADEGLNGRSINYPRGKALGGCSSINAMIYMRGQARDYDVWRQMGNRGWGWDDVLPCFLRSEDYALGADEFHATGGELRVEARPLRWEILDAFRDAAVDAGIPATDDFNRGDNEGIGYVKVTQKRGVRWSTAKAFLRPALGRPNLTVVTDAQVERIAFQDNRVAGIEFGYAGQPARAAARGEVILAAGAIGSPHILQLSGIGPGEVLAAHGIQPVHELPGVGANLQDHLQLRLIYKVKNTVTMNQKANSWPAKAWMALEYALFRSGPLTMAPSQLCGFTRSDPSMETPNLQFHIQPLSLDKFGDPLHRFPAFTATVANLRPESRGSVHIKSPDPAAHPAIKPNYLAHARDQEIAAESIRLTRRICAGPKLARFAPEELKPGAHIQDHEDLVNAARDIGTTIFHPVGTCKMGNDPMAVVDDRLRVHGVLGLRVVDASIMPTITSGNTNAPTIMIAEKASDILRRDRRQAAA